MRNGKIVHYENAEKAKYLLLDLMEELMADNAPIKEIQQLDTITSKLEAWTNKFVEHIRKDDLSES